MEATAQYVEMMIASLEKKRKLLDDIIEANKQLEDLTAQPSMDMDGFRQLMDKKDDCVQQITQLDTGFPTVFDKVKEAINNNRKDYQEQILTMQKHIRGIADRTMVIEKTEERLRLVIEGHFAKMHQEAQIAKKGMHVAQNYYKSMSGTHIIDSQFMDKKK